MSLSNLSAGQKILASFGGVAVLIAVTGSVFLWAMGEATKSGIEVGERLAPVADAAMEMRLNASQGYMEFEQVMAGVSGAKIEQVWQRLDEARFYTDAILIGGKNEKGIFYASGSPEVRRLVQAVRVDLDRFVDTAKRRRAMLSRRQGFGGGAEEEFDALYDILIEDTAAVAALAPDDAVAQRLIGEARFLIANGHRLVEEVLGGDATEDFAQATGAFAEAQAQLRAAADQSYAARATIEPLLGGVDRFIALAEQRHQNAAQLASDLASAAAEFNAAYTDFVAKADAAEAVIHDAMDAGLEEMRADERLATYATGAGMLLIGLAILLSYRWLEAQFGARLRALAAVMRRLIAGDLEAEVPSWRATDEIGILRDSVGSFRDLLIHQHKLEAQARVERAEVNRRAEAAAALNAKLGALVGHVVEGRLDARLGAKHGNDALDRVAEGVDQLVETVESVIGELNGLMGRMAAGDFSTRIEGRFKGTFAELGANANATSDRLARMIDELRGLTARASGETSEIAGQSRELASQAESQAASIEETAAASEEMGRRIANTAERSQRAAGKAREAETRAEEGQGVVAKSTESMQAIKDASARISDIIGVIESLAFQTNLLALNAAVEAARAGDAGKGFAVVAAEVGSLAQRSSQAAKDIAALIQDSTAKVEQGVDLAEATGAALGAIREVVVELSGEIQEISTENGHAAASVAETGSVINALDANTQRTAQVAERTAGATHALDDLMREVAAMTERFRTARGPRETRRDAA